MLKKKSVRDFDLKGKRVLIRADFNVPLDDKLNITDDTRIRAALPTVKYVLDGGGSVILMSHLGRPKGEVKEELRLTPVADRLSKLLKKDVKRLNDCIGSGVKEAVSAIKPGDVILLENLRFHKEETKNDPSFAKELASLGDIYVNDAFGTCHRAHASTEGVTKFLPAASGFLVEKEIEYFERLIQNPEKPYIAILGGAKVSDKIQVFERLMDNVDTILIGGAMAYTFLKSQGIGVGGSKLESDKLDLAKSILENARKKNVNLVLPIDHIVADKLANDANTKEVGREIPDGLIGLDIGTKTIDKFKEILKGAKTVVWNGPVGFFEMDKFSNGTREIARFLAGSKATTVIGGGDTAAAIMNLGLQDKMSHISTGGGASLEYLEGKVLPGVAALNDK
ncbi:MAG: phosphoglycerate kinase [Candidatus Omnitrophica bacterium]|nr:phosphoglycerate kinase [Candidatus Omnitrophota bacterium]